MLPDLATLTEQGWPVRSPPFPTFTPMNFLSMVRLAERHDPLPFLADKAIMVAVLLLCTITCSAQIVKNKLIRREIHFPTSEWRIPEAERTAIERICAELVDRDNYRLAVVGHTDSVGNAAYNQDLSKKRAEQVKDLLIGCGARADKLEAKGISYTAPTASNATEDGKQKNRRTTVVLTLVYFSVSALEPVEGLRPGATFDLNVLFKFNNAEFQKGSTANLDLIVALLSRYPDLQFEILGWTAISQSDGSDLSGERAKAVHDYLMEKGVDPRRMTYKGMGGAGCAGFKMLEKCRRVEIAITRNPYRKEVKP